MYQNKPAHPDHSGRADAPTRPDKRVIIAGVIAVLALIFVFQNTNKGRISFWFWDVTAPAWIWLVLLFASGVIVGSLFPWLRRRSGGKARS